MSNPWLVIVEPFTFTASGTGSGYADGTYFGVALNGAGGTGALATVVVASNAVVFELPPNTEGPETGVTALGSGYTAGGTFTVALSVGGGSGITLNCSVGGPTDQTLRMDGSSGQKGSFRSMMLQRSNADIPLRVAAGDLYAPTIGCQIYLYDWTLAGVGTTVFAGTIDRKELTWDGTQGWRIYHLTCASMESFFDTIRVGPSGAASFFCGPQITAMFSALMTGTPITLGTVDDGAFVPYKAWGNYPRFSEIIQDLATLSEFVWGVAAGPPSGLLPSSLEFYFQPLTTTPSPFSLATDQIQWQTMKFDQNRADYRNRQILQIQATAFAQSSELFPWNGVLPAHFVLLRPPETVTFAFALTGIQSSALGTFTGQPSPGDTISIGYPTSGSIYNWVANSPYQVGQIIIDGNGFEWTVTAVSSPTSNHSGATIPPFTSNDNVGATLSDFQIVWTCNGKPLDGNYVFVVADGLDNTQWGQVVIGTTLAETIQNLVDAINCNQGATAQGIEFSWPTWENPLVNAYNSTATPPAYISPPGSNQILVANKPAGNYTAQLGKSCANFSWSGSQTSGGVANTVTALQIAINGQSASANIYYTPGELTVSLASVPAGTHAGSIQIQYTRLGGDCIICEDTFDVVARAAIEHSNGKYQQYTSDTNQGSNSAGLQECQAALAAWLPIPTAFTFETIISGLLPGQWLAISMSDVPPGIANLVNGNYAIQEVRGDLIVTPQALALEALGGPPSSGHYRYTVDVIDVAQIGSWLRFWQDLLGGGGQGTGGGGGGGGTSQIYVAQFDIADSTMGDDVGPVVPITSNANALRMLGVLRAAITSDLTVRLNMVLGLSSVVIGSITIPHTTALNTPVTSTTFTTTALIRDHVILWDITASDGQIIPDSVATVRLEYQ
jgi:hypothetical protein